MTKNSTIQSKRLRNKRRRKSTLLNIVGKNDTDNVKRHEILNERNGITYRKRQGDTKKSDDEIKDAK